MLELSTPVQYIKGIGPRLAEVLSAKGIATVADLLFYLPFRYEDRLNPRGIAELRPGEMATVIAEVRNSGLFRTRRMPIFQMTAGQGRARLKCLWFNGTYLRDRFKPGQMVALYGKVEADDRTGELQIMQPQFEILGEPAEDGSSDAVDQKQAASLEVGRIVPIYESAGQGRLTARWFRRIIRQALENIPQTLPDPIPAAVRARMSLISPIEAMWKVHWPDAGESLADLQSSRTPAHLRLIFEELFFVELGLEFRRRQMKAQTGIAFRLDDRAREAIKKILPFHPDGRTEAGPERNCCRHGEALSHAAPAARGRWIGQNNRGVRSGHHRHRKRLPGRPDGAHRNSGATALLFRAANSRKRWVPHRAVDRLGRTGSQA